MVEASPCVFLSYTRQQPDEDWILRIVDVLDRRYGVKFVFDKRHIVPGHDFRAEIKRLIRESDAILFLGSSSSVINPECVRECEYACNQGKPIIPLFIEDVGWGIFPQHFRPLHYEQLQRAENEDQFDAMIGKGLLAARLGVDSTKVPEPATTFDVWAGFVHPPYGKVRQADMTGLRKYVEECSNKLKLSVEHGYHNLNLALLFLRLHEHRRAIDYAEKALSDLPGRSDAYYFEALIRAAGAPLLVLPHASARQIMRSLDTAIHLGIESLPKSRSAGAGLPWLLKAIIAHDYYARNGLIPPTGQPEALLQETRSREHDAQELDRLFDSLSGLSAWSLSAIESLKGQAQW